MERQIIEVTEKEHQITQNNIYIKNEVHSKVDYRNGVCVKPWGYEFLVYESAKIGMWFLTIKRGHSTSLHCHFNKDTIIIVLKGSAIIHLVDNKVINLGCMSSIFLPKYNFHGLSSFSEETVLLEIEVYNNRASFSDKNDLLRINDQYKRKNVGYEGSIQLMKDEETLQQYNYFYLDQGFHKMVEGVQFQVRELTEKNRDSFLVNKDSYHIVMDGVLFRDMMYLKEGSMIDSFRNVQLINDKALILSLEKSNYMEDNKLIYNEEQLKLVVEKLKEQKKRVILSSGCYDIIHVGHINTLREAKKLGDVLMICLSSDEQIKALKGEDRPVNHFQDRVDLFKTISYVDYVILYNEQNIEREETLGNIMKIVDPYYWVKGSDYTESQILAKHPYLKRIKLIGNIENVSTTNIIKKIHTSVSK